MQTVLKDPRRQGDMNTKTTRDDSVGGSDAHLRKLGRWAATSALLAVALIFLAACGNSGHGGGRQGHGGAQGSHRGNSRSIPVQAAKVSYGPLNAVHNVAGTVSPVTQSNVAAQVSGVVKKIVHNAGDWVKSGETVVQLDNSQLEIAVKNAQVSLQNAKINLQVGQQNTSSDRKKLELQLQAAKSSLSAAQKNYDALNSGYKQGNVAASDLDTAQSQLQTAEANYQSAKTALDQNKNAQTQSIAQLKLSVQTAQNQLQQAKLNLENASIAAPFAGQISVVHVSPGEFVGQNTPAFLIVSQDRQITFNVPPSDAPVLTLGTNVKFAVGGNTYTATINQSPAAPVNGVVPLTAKLAGSTDLPFGTVGTVSYPVTVSKGTLVPLAALQNDGSQNYVFTIEQGKAHVQPITILGETGSTAAVSGLQSGSEVVLNPPPGLLGGAAVVASGNGQNANSSQSGGSPQGTSSSGGGQNGAKSGSQQGAAPAKGAGNQTSGGQGNAKSAGPASSSGGHASG